MRRILAPVPLVVAATSPRRSGDIHPQMQKEGGEHSRRPPDAISPGLA